MAGTQKDILNEILVEIGKMKTKLPNGELKRMEQTINALHEFQQDLKEDFSDSLLIDSLQLYLHLLAYPLIHP